MRHSHRAAHRLIWPALALAMALGFGLALGLRPPIPVSAPAGETSR